MTVVSIYRSGDGASAHCLVAGGAFAGDWALGVGERGGGEGIEATATNSGSSLASMANTMSTAIQVTSFGFV